MKLSTGLLKSVLVVVIVLIMVMTALAETSTDVGTAADAIVAANGTYPLTSFFKKKGIVLLGFMSGIALTVILAVLPSGK